MVAEIIKVVHPHRRNAAVVPDRGSRGSHVSDSRYGSRCHRARYLVPETPNPPGPRHTAAEML